MFLLVFCVGAGCLFILVIFYGFGKLFLRFVSSGTWGILCWCYFFDLCAFTCIMFDVICDLWDRGCYWLLYLAWVL